MSLEEQIRYWFNQAEEDIASATSLFNSGHYVWSFFVGHLALEKLIKAIYVRDNQETPPKTHDLVKLANATRIAVSASQKEALFLINAFNIEARYPDYKTHLSRKATAEFTKENLDRIKETYQWLKSQIH